jgi:hypothetical protein
MIDVENAKRAAGEKKNDVQLMAYGIGLSQPSGAGSGQDAQTNTAEGNPTFIVEQQTDGEKVDTNDPTNLEEIGSDSLAEAANVGQDPGGDTGNDDHFSTVQQ